MSTQDLLDRISALPERPRDRPTAPPIEVVAFVVRWNRGLRNWKKSTLADFARVSISTIERVERGERVSDEALDRIGQAFGYQPEQFTTPRIPLGSEAASSALIESYSTLSAVPVKRMNSERTVREAAKCDAYLIHRPEVASSYDADIETLQVWLDLASFSLTELIVRDPREAVHRRELYGKILAHVREIERRGLTVLSGVMSAPKAGPLDWKVAVISLSPKLTDPGASKRKHIMVDRRIFSSLNGSTAT